MKRRVDELAVFGGAPTFPEPLHVGRPVVADPSRLLARIAGVLERRWLTNHGPCVQELEARVSALTGTEHAIAVASGTLGLQIAARALGLEGEVIVPALTFVATPHAFEWLGLRPVFCDVDPRTHGIDPAAVERLISPRTTAIVGVHLWGRVCAVDALEELARRHRLKLVFDAAHAFACTHRGRAVGRFGDVEVFSFHATKFVQSFEGGMVTTGDGALAARLRAMRDFGFADYDTVVGLGINAKMPEVSAAMGLASLEGMAGTIAANRRSYHRYRRELGGIPGIRLYEHDEAERCNYQYVVVEVDGPISRDDLHHVLWAENVLARRYFVPGCHRVEPYRSREPRAAARLPVTERLLACLLCLPTGPAVGAPDISEVCGLIRLVVDAAAEVRGRLAAAVVTPP
jgi:dTDP-4-amino-4,6-dideoxygalactose transaminase